MIVTLREIRFYRGRWFLQRRKLMGFIDSLCLQRSAARTRVTGTKFLPHVREGKGRGPGKERSDLSSVCVFGGMMWPHC